MSQSASTLAWSVTSPCDEEGRSEVVFAPTQGRAKLLGVYFFDGAFEFTEIRARRAKEFDGLLGKNDLRRAQLEAGWWFTCAFCEERVTEDGMDDDDEDAPPKRYVVRSGEVYCSSKCCIERLREIRGYRVNEWETVREATERWPGIEVISRSGLTLPHDRSARGAVGSVDFRFPGGLGVVMWIRGDAEVFVEMRDHEAWARFTASGGGS